MTALLITILIILIILLILTYGVYKYTFVHNIGDRINPLEMTDSDKEYYGDFTDEMQKSCNKIHDTENKHVFIKSFDNLKLNGHLYNNFPNRPLVIFFHGYHGSYMRDGYGMFRYCMSHELNILMVEQRAHCKSEGNLISFGINERKDAIEWVNYAKTIMPEDTKIILSGVSMGAATVMMASDILDNDPSVICFIEDCGYTTPEAIIKNTAASMFKPLEKCYPLAALAAKLCGKFDLSSASALSSVSKIKKPMLFIHGGADTFVPTEMCGILYNECTSEKKAMKIIENAKHAISSLLDYKSYEACIDEFLADIVE